MLRETSMAKSLVVNADRGQIRPKRRDAISYSDDAIASNTDRPLLMDASSWAREFLHMNAAFRSCLKRARLKECSKGQNSRITLVEAHASEQLKPWGVLGAVGENAPAKLLWSPNVYPNVLPIVASVPRGGSDDVVNFNELPVPIFVMRCGPYEHVLIDSGENSMQVAVSGESILGGPVALSFQIEGPAATDKLDTLKRFFEMLQSGQVPPAPAVRSRRVSLWTLALRTFPHAALGQNDHEIARILYPDHNTTRWSPSNEWIRTKIRRGKSIARYLVGGGYLKILSPDNPDSPPLGGSSVQLNCGA